MLSHNTDATQPLRTVTEFDARGFFKTERIADGMHDLLVTPAGVTFSAEFQNGKIVQIFGKDAQGNQIPVSFVQKTETSHGPNPAPAKKTCMICSDTVPRACVEIDCKRIVIIKS